MFSSRRRFLRTAQTLLLIGPAALGAARGASAQTQDPPKLFINHGGHTGVVRQVLYTPDGKDLISVGDDKAIRVWDATEGKEIGDPIYGQVGDNESDMLDCAALGPADANGARLLAVAGSTHVGPVSGTDFKANRFVIRLFDLKSIGADRADASLAALLPAKSDGRTLGHGGVIVGLAFSPDGKRLASCSADSTARVWNLADGKSVVLGGRTFYSPSQATMPDEHLAAVTGLAWSPRGDRLATAGADGTIRIWNPDARDGTDTLGDSRQGTSVNVLNVGETVNCLAWSGRMLVAGTRQEDAQHRPVGGTVYSWDTDHLNADPAILGKKDKPISCIAVSPDGRMIAAGQDDTKPNDTCQVLLWSSTGPGRFQEMSAYQAHPAAVTAVAFAPDSTRVASADAVGDIFLWRPQDRDVPPQKLVGAGAPTQAIAWAQDAATATDYVRWTSGGSDYVYDFEHALCVDAASPVTPKNANWRGAARTAQAAGKSLRLELASDSLSVTVKGGAQDVSVQPSDADASRDTITATTLTPDGTGVVVGSLYKLALYNAATGQEMQEFSGHAAKITSVAVSADGRYLASTSNDQTVCVWKLGGGSERVLPLLSIFASPGVGNPVDLRYVVWVDHGFYACSPNGQNIIGWQRNKGDDAQAEYDAAGKLPSLRNAAVVEAVWRDGDIVDALTDAKVAGDVKDTEPPTVKLQGLDGTSSAAQRIVVTALVTPGSLPLKKVVFSVDGEPIDVPASDAGPVTVTHAVTLRKGEKNTVSVTAYDTGTDNGTDEAKVVCTLPPDPPRKPVLNVLAIGIRRYEKFLDLKYPDRDAKDLAATLALQKGRLFGDVKTDVLVNQNATHDAILSHVQALCRNNASAGDDDYTIVFVAGHGGQTDAAHYYLLPFDLDSSSMEMVEKTAIDWNDIYERLRHLRGHVILLLDTCHSAGATTAAEQEKNDREAAAKSEGYEAFTNDIQSDSDTHVSKLLVLTSCRPGEVSLESSDLKHGLFTKALLEMLRPADNPIARRHPGLSAVRFDQLVSSVQDYVQNYIEKYDKDQSSAQAGAPTDQFPRQLGTLTNEADSLPMADVDPVDAKTASR